MDRRQTGVRARGNSIIIDFTYQGERCRESLRIKPTKTALKEMHRKREAILHSIAIGNFDYADHFPNSPKAIKLTKTPARLITIEQALKDWLKKKSKRCQYSTLKGYNSVIYHHLIPEFGSLSLMDLQPSHIDNWQDSICISNKRINNVLSPLRQLYKDAFHDGLIDKNPMERIRHLPVEQQEPEPFTQQEITKILNQLAGTEHNLIQFAFWTGLRTSELIALRWQDIDFEMKRFYVRVAIVYKKEKTTKTASGLRTVEMNEQSLDSLRKQKTLSNGSERVFIDPKTNKEWKDQLIRKRVWMPALKAAGVKYRKPYQTRHTFASMMLSSGKDPTWLSHQMGHKDWGMLRKVYARWMPSEN